MVDGGNLNKEAEGVMGDDMNKTITSVANSNKEAGPVDGNDVNETIGNNKRRAKNERCGKDHAMKIAKTHNETDIGDDDEEEQGRQAVDGGNHNKEAEGVMGNDVNVTITSKDNSN